ncbi:MAG TPA: hypothetical protein VKF40_12120 [Burkholderiales bacterium]|nr:hypothetical protein [Burkholderiales bacterium]
MSLFGGVSGKDVDQFAKSLALDIAKRYPPAMDKGSAERKISQKRLSVILEDTLSKATTYRNQHKLGVYKKARLSNTFRWELQELGYSPEFINIATEGLVVYISRKS